MTTRMNDLVAFLCRLPACFVPSDLRWLGLVVACTAVSVFGQRASEPLSLEAAQRMFLERNPRVQLLRQRIAEAEGLGRQAAKRPNPTLRFSQEGFPLGRSESGFDDQEFLFWASHELELGGKRRRRQEVARQAVAVARADLEDFLRSGRAQVARLFVRVSNLQRQRDLAAGLLEKYRQLRGAHQQRLEEGDASGLDYLKIQAEEIRYRTVLAEIETTVAAAWRNLAALLDWPSAVPPPLQTMPGSKPPLRSLEELLALAQASRPDLQVKRREFTKAKAELALSRAKGVPNLTVGGGYKRDFGQNSFYIGLELPLPLFDRKRGLIEASAARVEAAKQASRWQEVLVNKQVAEAWHRLSSQREASSRLGEGVMSQLETIVEITTRSYTEGEASLLELLDSMRVRLEASLGFTKLQLQILIARIDLEEAVGAELD